MDKKIIDVLDVLDNGAELSQREIAEKTGISLGMVNALIKKCVKKGLVKIEKLNSRSIRYILTPAGIKEKTKKTVNYIKKSYRAIVMIQKIVRSAAVKADEREKKIILLGKKDEIYQLAVDVLNKENLEFEHFENIEKLTNSHKELFVIYWNHEFDDEKLKEEDIESINIFSN